jgi:hypothetical protein
MAWWSWLSLGLVCWALVILLIVVVNHRFWTFVDPHPLDDASFDMAHGLLAENRRLAEELRLREESQIPVMPAGAQRRMSELIAENNRLRDALIFIMDFPNGVGDRSPARVAADALEGNPSSIQVVGT